MAPRASRACRISRSLGQSRTFAVYAKPQRAHRPELVEWCAAAISRRASVDCLVRFRVAGVRCSPRFANSRRATAAVGHKGACLGAAKPHSAHRPSSDTCCVVIRKSCSVVSDGTGRDRTFDLLSTLGASTKVFIAGLAFCAMENAGRAGTRLVPSPGRCRGRGTSLGGRGLRLGDQRLGSSDTVASFRQNVPSKANHIKHVLCAYPSKEAAKCLEMRTRWVGRCP